MMVKMVYIFIEIFLIHIRDVINGLLQIPNESRLDFNQCISLLAVYLVLLGILILC